MRIDFLEIYTIGESFLKSMGIIFEEIHFKKSSFEFIKIELCSIRESFSICMAIVFEEIHFRKSSFDLEKKGV